MKELLSKLLEQEDIFKPPTEEELLKRFIEGYSGKLNPDGTYDFDCSLYNLSSVVKNGKFIIKFGKVKGNFYCYECGLTTLEGAPKYVGGSFYCSYNNLTSLKGAPERVEGNFDCAFNDLTSLEGAPERVGGNFVCHDNNLTSLEGAPKYVGGNFGCSHNKLTSLEGAPEYVGRGFYCYDNLVKFTREDVSKVSEVKGEIIV